jgi:hypothetical protein
MPIHGQDQMPESLKRTEEIERLKTEGVRIQKPERTDKTEEIEKAKKNK